MRCSKSALNASAFVIITALIVGSTSSYAQGRSRVRSSAGAASESSSSSEEDDRSENMKMPNVSIEGERQTPDIFFVFPTGKGGNLSAPRMRDYAADILEPVVKPWFEKDQAVNITARVTSAEKFNWDEALRSEPDRIPAAAAAPPPVAPPAAAFPSSSSSIPPSASSIPRSASQFPTANQMPPTANRIPPPANQYPATADGYVPPDATQAPPSQGQLGNRYSVQPARPGGYQPQIPSQALSLPSGR